MKKKVPKSGNFQKPDRKPTLKAEPEREAARPKKEGAPTSKNKKSRFGGQEEVKGKSFGKLRKSPGVNKPIKKSSKATPPTDDGTTRLNRYMAHAGVASRRKCDEIILQGDVEVNGQVVKEVGYRLQPTDVVRYKGKVLKPVRNLVYILLNKPKDYLTTTSDDKDRHTVMELVSKATNERIYPVGRLDRQTTGLLLLTNDGDLAQKLSHPSFMCKKIYHAVLDKPLTEADMEKIAAGLILEDGVATIDKIAYAHHSDKAEIGIELHIGRNRIVRRIFEHLGYEVVKLDRVLYAGLTKKDLPRGRWRHLSEKEVIMLKHFT
ncbi:MAG: pseudouridine synthase [Chitinophagales bacterium]|nr:pseudouridine synthase [Chitinophagales bacterium]